MKGINEQIYKLALSQEEDTGIKHHITRRQVLLVLNSAIKITEIHKVLREVKDGQEQDRVQA